MESSLALLASFSAGAVQKFSQYQRRHVTTIRDGIMVARRQKVLSRKTVKQVQDLDFAYKICRHISGVHTSDVLKRLERELSYHANDKYEIIEDASDFAAVDVASSSTVAPSSPLPDLSSSSSSDGSAFDPSLPPELPVARDLLKDHTAALFDIFSDSGDNDDIEQLTPLALVPLPAFQEIDLRNAFGDLLETVNRQRAVLYDLSTLNDTQATENEKIINDMQACEDEKTVGEIDTYKIEIDYMKVMSALHKLARSAAVVDDIFPDINPELALGVFHGFDVGADDFELEEDPPVCSHLDAMECMRRLEGERNV